MSLSNRVNWKDFFSDLKTGDWFIADASTKASAASSAKKYGIKLKCRKLAENKYACKVDHAIDLRQSILSTFASLSLHQLQAIYKAANQAKIIT